MNTTPITRSGSGYYERVCKSAGSWLYWIAGATVVIVAINILGGRVNSYFALFVPTVLAGDRAYGAIGLIMAVIMAVVTLVVFGGLGLFATRGVRWAFITGIVFYAIDAAVFAAAKYWLGAALHAYVLYRMFGGIDAAKQLAVVRDAERAAAAQPVGAWHTPPPAGPVVPQPVPAGPTATSDP